MFTGIVKEVARVEKISRTSSLLSLAIRSKIVSVDAEKADSISVNGICLTLVEKRSDVLFFQTLPSTLKNTNLKRIKRGDCVNLEPALKTQDRVGGHFVLGHVDTEVKLRRIITRSGYWQLEIEFPSRFKKFVIENGSVALEGISLTVKKILPRVFTVEVVPFTYNHTTLKHKKSGAWLNIEFDYLLKDREVAQFG